MLENLQITTLSNGIRIVTVEEPHSEAVRAGIWVNVGNRNETEETCGASHFIEHLLFKGTKKRSARSISQAIEGQGGEINAFTGTEFTCFYAIVPYEKAHNAFNVLGDIFYNSVFSPTEIEKERSVVIEEIKMYADRPDSVAQEKLDSLLWEGHPLGRPILGFEEGISKISRETLLSYKETHYHTQNTIFTFFGRIKHETAVKYVESLAGALPRQSKILPEPYVNAIPQGRLVFEKKAINQTHLAFGWRIAGMRHETHAAMELASCLLGENMSSRLFQKIREKQGLCYSIASWTSLLSDCGSFNIAAGCDANQAKQCAKSILVELQKLRSSPVSAAELRRTRDYFTGTLRLRLERNPISWIIKNIVFCKNPTTLPELLEEFRRVTVDEIQDAVQILTPSAASLAVISPEQVKTTSADWLRIIK